jgi:colanic acid/amylovoran biosynthesis glycosyltransferase
MGRVSNIQATFLGKIPQTAVAEELTKAHIFCVPSIREALGVANLEAMAYGIPVVSTAVGGIPEVLGYGRCGWMVAPGDPQALAFALEECITRPELRSLKRENALRHVQKFDITSMFDNFLKIIAL